MTPVICLAGREPDGTLGDVNNIVAVSPELEQVLSDFPLFQPLFSRTTGSTTYANMCAACGALQGQHFMHSQPGGPFFAVHAREAELTVIPIEGPTEVTVDLEPYHDLGDWRSADGA